MIVSGVNYYITSVTLIVTACLPFLVRFESQGKTAKEITILAVFAALAVAGRAAFFMIPQFKPVAAVVIIAGICFGGEGGFIVGAVTAFVSNFFFSQGIWTPFQMFAFALVGLLAGLIFHGSAARFAAKKALQQRIILSLYGFFSVLILYGGIVDISTILTMSEAISPAAIAGVYLAALPFNLIHAGSTVLFLNLLAPPIIRRVNRLQLRYGMQ